MAALGGDVTPDRGRHLGACLTVQRRHTRDVTLMWRPYVHSDLPSPIGRNCPGIEPGHRASRETRGFDAGVAGVSVGCLTVQRRHTRDVTLM